ncbi:MAG: hypothetical protein BZ137_04605 [Methanosphaera sp. rholeuAM130]|nr:MAG: hypothetical protein BZ137_04605 [Methanosphaera sp. rholeuAM130]
MLEESLNKEWKMDFFEIFSRQENTREDLEKADKLKFEHFPPVVAKFYTDTDNVDVDELCTSKIKLRKAKLSKNYNGDIIKINYEKLIKEQLNNVTGQQIENLKLEDPNFLKDDEKDIIEKADFPFIKLMTLVYSKDTGEMTSDDQIKWKNTMNGFINQQIIFVLVNTYFTMKLYQDNIYTQTFQTPYNKIHTWKKYANDHEGICLTYDFKEISQINAYHLSKLFPVVYSSHELSRDDFSYDIYNAYCASLIKIDDDINDEDNGWEYIYSYKYDEKEYSILDRILQPAYEKVMNHPKILEKTNKDYLSMDGQYLEYDYKSIISEVVNLLESREIFDLIKDDLENVYSITDDEIEVNFLKPEALYLGLNFPEDKIEQYNTLATKNDVKIFRIKEGNGILYKSLI